MFLNNDFSQMICVHIEIQNNLHKNSELSDFTKFLDRKSNVKKSILFLYTISKQKVKFYKLCHLQKVFKNPLST